MAHYGCDCSLYLYTAQGCNSPAEGYAADYTGVISNYSLVVRPGSLSEVGDPAGTQCPASDAQIVGLKGAAEAGGVGKNPDTNVSADWNSVLATPAGTEPDCAVGKVGQSAGVIVYKGTGLKPVGVNSAVGG